MSDSHTVAVLGLGLIGGSIARDLDALHYHVLGYDVDAPTLRRACDEGVVDTALDQSLEGLERATTVVLAVPVSASSSLLAAVSSHLAPSALVIDVGSTKCSVIAAAESLGLGERFVGTHPMAGDHRSGWNAARTGLFDGATVFLCTTMSTRLDVLDRARELWSALGAKTKLVTAEEHDARLAFSSHLPQVTSTAIALTLGAADVHPRDLGPGGRDALRIAGSSEEMWTAIALENSDALLSALGALETQLSSVKQALMARDEDALRALFRRAREWKESG